MLKTNLSVTIITLNEGEDLPRCLESIKRIADEVIVVDSGSTDKTVAIARKNGAKVYLRKFDNYAYQKNYAVSKTVGKWILSLDADEEISRKLAKEIKLLIISNKSPYVAYTIPRKNIIFGKFIKYTRWQPELDRHIWLFKKGSGKWVGDVHEEFIVNGKVGKLQYTKIHNQYRTVSEFISMMNRYSELEASEKARKVRFSIIRMIYDPLYNFVVRYFYRLGFLDGWRGFVLSYLIAIYHLELWIKIWGIQKK